MAIIRTYSCDVCGYSFDHLHMDRDEPYPECPYCASTTRREISMPHIAKTIGKAGDMSYRQMERASEVRAQMAAETAGVDVSEMAALKISDFSDNTIQG